MSLDEPVQTSPPARILVVDDDEKNHELIRDTLEPRGYQVECADCGADALACAAARLPDVVLLDVEMPGMDGLEVCRRLKADPRTNAVPVIMVTAETDRSDRLRGMEAGANDYLLKPVDLQDLTLRVRNAAALRHLSKELQLSLAEVQRQERLRDNLAAMLVHDLRTPLSSMMLSLDVIEATAGDRLAQAAKDSIGVCKRSVAKLVEMTSAILEVTRLEAGKLPLKRRACNLGTIAAAAVEPFTVAGRGQCRPRLLIPPLDLPVQCDSELIRRVIANIVGNAIKFVPAKGSILVRVTAETGGVCVEVADNGPGIPPEFHEKIFDKFGQVDARKNHHSTGIGLYFCKLVVHAHGGRIGVRSEPGQGSTFWFTLPVSP